jgi:hypothetical protein
MRETTSSPYVHIKIENGSTLTSHQPLRDWINNVKQKLDRDSYIHLPYISKVFTGEKFAKVNVKIPEKDSTTVTLEIAKKEGASFTDAEAHALLQYLSSLWNRDPILRRYSSIMDLFNLGQTFVAKSNPLQETEIQPPLPKEEAA